MLFNYLLKKFGRNKNIKLIIKFICVKFGLFLLEVLIFNF